MQFPLRGEGKGYSHKGTVLRALLFLLFYGFGVGAALCGRPNFNPQPLVLLASPSVLPASTTGANTILVYL